MPKSLTSLPETEPRTIRVLRFPPDLHKALKREMRHRNVTVRGMFYKVVQERLPKTVQALEELGFADVPAGTKRKPMRVRVPVSLLEDLRKAEARTGLDPMAILFILLRAELKRD